MAEYLGNSRGTADHILPAACHKPHEDDGQCLHIAFLQGVGSDIPVSPGVQELLLYCFKIERTQFPECDGEYIVRMYPAACFFGYVIRQVRMAVAEGAVPCELRLCGRYQEITFLYVMHAIERKAFAFHEKGAENLSGKSGTARAFKLSSQDIRFQGIVPPQCGITSGYDQKGAAGLPGGMGDVPGDLPVYFLRTEGGKAAGVGEHKEHAIPGRQKLPEGFLFPVCDDGNTVYRLYPGRIVIQNDDL